MFPFALPLLIGAAGGALMNKKDPLKGALLGGGLGAAGGAFLPGLMGAGGAGGGLLGGAAPAAAADPLAAYMATGGAEGSIMGNALTGAGGASGAVGPGSTAGLLGNIKAGMSYVKPVGDAMGAASMAKGLLFPQSQGVQASPVMQPTAMPNTLPALSQQLDQGVMQQREQDAARRQRRKQLIGGM